MIALSSSDWRRGHVPVSGILYPGETMYEVVFDLAEEGYREWRFAALGIPLVIAGAGLLVFRRRLLGARFSGLALIFAIPFFSSSVFWTAVALATTYGEYRRLRGALADDVAKTNLTAILEQHGMSNVRSL